jgi:hypothetical protein
MINTAKFKGGPLLFENLLPVVAKESGISITYYGVGISLMRISAMDLAE